MTKRAFRGWVIASVFLMIAWIAADFATVGHLPEDLRAFQTREPEMTPAFLGIIFVGLALMAIYGIATVGLFLFWRPARVLYLIGSIGGFSIPFFLGPTVSSAISNAMAYLDCAVSRFILELLY